MTELQAKLIEILEEAGKRVLADTDTSLGVFVVVLGERDSRVQFYTGHNLALIGLVEVGLDDLRKQTRDKLAKPNVPGGSVLRLVPPVPPDA